MEIDKTNDLYEILNDFFDNKINHLNFSQFGKIISYDGVANMAIVKLLANSNFLNNGEFEAVEQPILYDIPVLALSGIPTNIKANDICYVVFNHFDIEEFKGEQYTPRPHQTLSINNAICLPIVYNNPEKVSIRNNVDSLGNILTSIIDEVSGIITTGGDTISPATKTKLDALKIKISSVFE